jgi:hypothetical protein
VAWLRREPDAFMGVHETVRKLSTRPSLSPRRVLILAGALAAGLAGLSVGAETRRAAPLAHRTLGPRLDFDLAAHALAPAVTRHAPGQVAASYRAGRRR